MRNEILISVLVALAPYAARAATEMTVSVSDGRVVEGEPGTRSVELVVMLSQTVSEPVRVDYATRDGTAVAGSDYRAANGTLTFAARERAKLIVVSVIGDATEESDEMFDVVLSNAIGAVLGDSAGTVTIVSDDFRPSRNLSIYEVKFTYTGIAGSLANAPDCPVRPLSHCVLSGLVAGNENVSSDDDLEYTGILQLQVDIDLCETTGEGDSARLCAITVVGGGPVTAILDVYFDDRGGYLRNRPARGGTIQAVAYGSCDSAADSEELAIFPFNSRANPFGGVDLPLPSGPLQVGQVTQDDLTFEVVRVVRIGARRR